MPARHSSHAWQTRRITASRSPFPQHRKRACSVPTTDSTAGRGSPYRPPEDGPLPDLPLYERLIDDGIADRRRPGQPRRPRHRPAAGHLAGRPAAATGLRPGPGPLRRHRRDQPGAQDPAAHPRPLRQPTLTSRRPPGSCNTASPAAPTSARSARTSAPPATRSTAPTSCSPARHAAGPARPRPAPSRPGRRPTDPGSPPWPTPTPRPRRSPSSSTPPRRTPPCSPSPRTPTSAKPTSARSSSSARACPKAPTAAATARPSPPARPGSPPGCAPSSSAYRTAIEREAAQAVALTSAPPGQIRGEKEAVIGQHDLEAGE